jgi:hypothetical protein
MIIIENKKIHDFIVEKDKLVDEGRALAKDLDVIQDKITDYETKEKAITEKVKAPKELEEEGNKIAKIIEDSMKRLEVLGQQIEQTKLDAIPKKMKEEHQALMDTRKEKESMQAKIALKIQKIKDRIVPKIQKDITPSLRRSKMKEIDIGKFEDIETARTKDGKIMINTFNHLEDWMRKFSQK